MKDTLFVFRPGFDDGGKDYFCPYCAQVIGMLTYYPQLRETLDVVELDFPKPRRPLADLLGEENQSCPVLVLRGEAVAVPDVRIGEANGRKFVTKTIEILRYLAATRGVPLPH
ncbi:MAG: DUF3088 domain-containing protein [Polyangiaceae bacterium]|nr:DUF3088 domain-containing protein [Polyangiaceae bacterium]